MPRALTLLLTDVVDSTHLNSQVGDAVMGPVWTAHDREARRLMRRWLAREIGRSDGFLLLFDEPCNALGFAHEYHRALEGLPVPLRARIGVHTGAVELRPNSAADVARGAPPLEVDGLALPVAARLMAAASAGQTLVSSDLRQALRLRSGEDCLTIRPPDAGAGEDNRYAADIGPALVRVRLVSHGHWRLKGVDAPLELFQAGADEDQIAPPGDSDKAYRVLDKEGLWLPARDIPHRLPVELDLFIGRTDALRAIAQRFESGARLVSLLGIGGIGKTRLSLRYARSWLGDYPGGAWFCDLSAAKGKDGIVYAVAQALEVPMDKSDPVELIGTAIAGRGRCLVILDNFEQVAQHAQDTLAAWLGRAPEARFIATSREVLNVVGEQALGLEPLEAADAEALLRARMSAGGLELQLAGTDSAAIKPLVELLDRLPLAIELAASRVSVMGPAEMLARMGERFKLLARRRGPLGRQSALRATLDWSWDLLSPAEQASLAQCSVFEGGFTLAAAEGVLDLSRFGGSASATDAIQALVEKSLLRRSLKHRFDLLRSVHDYAAERLAEAGHEAWAAAAARHWRYFGALGEQQAIADRCIEAENLVAACRRAIKGADLDCAADSLVLAWAALNLTGPFSVAIEMALALYRAAHPHAMQVAMTARWVSGSARYLAGEIAAARGDLEAAIWTGASLSLKARALGALGQLERSLGNLSRADELVDAGLRAARDTGDAGLVSRAYNALGILRLAQGRLDDAHESLVAGLEVARAAGDRRQQAALLGNIGVVERRRGHDEAAAGHYREALHLASVIGDRRFEGNMRSNLGLYYHHNGHAELALAELQLALSIAREAGLTRLLANVACNIGLVQEALGQHEAALGRYEEAARTAKRLQDGELEGHFKIYWGRSLMKVGRHEDAQRRLDDAQALIKDSADRTISGLLACAKAELAALHGSQDLSRHWYEMAVAHAQATGSAPNSELRQQLRKVNAKLSSR